MLYTIDSRAQSQKDVFDRLFYEMGTMGVANGEAEGPDPLTLSSPGSQIVCASDLQGGLCSDEIGLVKTLTARHTDLHACSKQAIKSFLQN